MRYEAMNSEALERTLQRRRAAPLEIRSTAPQTKRATLVAMLARWWRGTRSEAALMNAREDMLRDMGLSRGVIERWIGGRPFL
jgi:uncharacterized protein YjiS (DUF1127 family)